MSTNESDDWEKEVAVLLLGMEPGHLLESS